MQTNCFNSHKHFLLQVYETDVLPKMICENCLYKLELFTDFRERSARTETLLVNLLKEISGTKLSSSIGIIKVSPSNAALIDQNSMVMIQHHPLLGDHSIQNVADLDLSQLEQHHRDSILAQSEMILNHGNVDLGPHSLATLDLNHHDLTSQVWARRTIKL